MTSLPVILLINRMQLTDFRHFLAFLCFCLFFKIPAGRMFVSVSVSVSSGGETKDFETAKKKVFFYFLTFFIGQYIVAFFCVYGYNLCARRTVRRFPEKSALKGKWALFGVIKSDKYRSF